MALGPTSAAPALAALDQLGKTGQVKLCTFDISPAVVTALEKKQIEFAIDQQEWLQGYLPHRISRQLHQVRFDPEE